MSDASVSGVATGLCCALFHSFAYIVSRVYVIKRAGSSLRLLLGSHVYMGIMAIPSTIMLWPDQWPEPEKAALFLCGSFGFFVVGQFFMFQSMKYTQPSRVAPLLGVKVVLMGGVVFLIFGQTLTVLQWMALAVCSLGAVSLGLAGGRLSGLAIRSIMFAVAGYVASDLFISRLVGYFVNAGLPLIRAALFSLGFSYFIGFLVAVPMYFTRYSAPSIWADRWYAGAFALFWCAAMGFYYTTLGAVGPVFAVVLQSGRGILSVLLGSLVARMTHLALEQRLTVPVFLTRLFAAVTMLLALWLYGIA